MNRFIRESSEQSSKYRSSFFVILLFQLTTMARTSVLPVLGHEIHHRYHQPRQDYYSSQDLHSPVRWRKLSQNSGQGRPVDVMTDVINDLGVKILDRYLDDTGNVAFSPSGLGFILVALYEGSAGSSNREISDVLALPRDRRVTRIGLRDIHRRLRSYLNADAFLGGLTLNRDEINLRPDYEEILRFYGFDVSDSGTEVNSTTPNSLNDSMESLIPINSTMNPTSGENMDSNDTTSQSTAASTDPIETTTLNDAVDVITDISGGTNSAMSSGTNDFSSTKAATPEVMSESPSDMNLNSTNMGDSISSTESLSILNDSLTVRDSVETTSIMPIRRLEESASTESNDNRTGSSDESMKSTDSVSLPITTIPTSPMTILVSETMDNVVNKNEDSTTMGIENSTDNVVVEESRENSVVRKRRGILHGPEGYFSTLADDGLWLDGYGRLKNSDDYLTQDEDITVDLKRSIEVAFLVNGCDYSRVTAAAYTAFLPFAYFSSLSASLLEFPLDDPRYKILIMLPSDENGTRRLARILATKPITLRLLRRSLQSTWINAVVPSFMLRGFVTLTPYLQRLGISDVFDPRAADLSLMSTDLGVYARDIQQSIGVNIRNNAKGGIGNADGGNEKDKQNSEQRDDLARRVRGAHDLPPFFFAGGAISPRSHGNPYYPSFPGAGNPLFERNPLVPFVVDHPFLYFIVDDETSVTLLAGRIDDPLNTRML